MIHYEFPLNERTRKFMRLEEIFLRSESQLSGKGKYKENDLFDTLFNLMGTATRSDLKVELIQEVERQRYKFKLLNKTIKNLVILKKLSSLKSQLEKSSIKPGYYFGEDKFLQEIKARRDSPFGIVWTDFPEMHCWLQSETPESRKKYFIEKFSPFAPVKNAIFFLNNILRSNAINEALIIDDFKYQVKLDSTVKNDLVIIQIHNSPIVYPNLSSNKYAININFLPQKKHTVLAARPLKFKLGIASY